MIMLKRTFLVAWLAIAALPAFSAPPAEEIEHLLGFIAGSTCSFIRNGTDYEGAAAAEHIRKKYEHFKSEIASAEDFIRLAATKSEMSGQPYQVRCGSDAAMLAADWLQSEIATFRKTAP